MQQLSAKEAIWAIKASHSLRNAIIQEDLLLNEILDSEESCHFDLSIENCIFSQAFKALLGDYYGEMKIKNCVFKGEFMFHAVTCFKELNLAGNHFMRPARLDSGTNAGPLVIQNNIFESFVNFSDQDVRELASIVNNQFLGGTNLLHPFGGPYGAQFAKPPLLEANSGLDRYEML